MIEHAGTLPMKSHTANRTRYTRLLPHLAGDLLYRVVSRLADDGVPLPIAVHCLVRQRAVHLHSCPRLSGVASRAALPRSLWTCLLYTSPSPRD